MDGFEVFMAGLMIFIGVCIGVMWEGEGWRGDCAQIGTHRTSNYVYKCEVVK